MAASNLFIGWAPMTTVPEMISLVVLPMIKLGVPAQAINRDAVWLIIQDFKLLR
jgi:hypothetical protein